MTNEITVNLARALDIARDCIAANDKRHRDDGDQDSGLQGENTAALDIIDAALRGLRAPSPSASARKVPKPMRVWIDCEFNEFRGELISMALVAEDGREWYEVLPCAAPSKWVAKNVMPILGKSPVPRNRFVSSLRDWLMAYEAIHLVADWPEDITHFCQTLIIGPGQRISTPALTMEIRHDLDAESAIPHNALADARAIRDQHLSFLAAEARSA